MELDAIGKLADATNAVAETGAKAIEAAQSFGRIIKGPIEDLLGIVHDRVRFARWERQLALADKAETIMRTRGLLKPTRELPLNFAVPLLSTAMLEEDDELQETWARLLVNAGDAATEMELRTAYVEILKGMSAFDVKNLEVMAQTTQDFRGKTTPPILETWRLPQLSVAHDEVSGAGEPLSNDVGISLANLVRLGCVSPGSSTFGGKPIYQLVTVTRLGLALHRACS